jgi:DNA-binding transcriptional LysR family regulator
VLNHAHLARVDVNLLVLFDLLFEERHARRAAQRLNLTPSAISHSLRRLRELFDDPLFIPSAKGLSPTQRAQDVAPDIRALVETVSALVSHVPTFDPASAERTFRIGGPDAAISTFVPALVRALERSAPKIDLAVIQLLPRPSSLDAATAWSDCLAALESGRIDLAVLPYVPQQKRFKAVPIVAEDFVFIVRAGHPLVKTASLKRITSARHVLVSASGDRSGFVDQLLAARGHRRRIALTVPNFHMAADAVASSDLVCAVPRRFAHAVSKAFAVALVEPPFEMGSADLNIVVHRTALLDKGISWIADQVARACGRDGLG